MELEKVSELAAFQHGSPTLSWSSVLTVVSHAEGLHLAAILHFHDVQALTSLLHGGHAAACGYELTVHIVNFHFSVGSDLCSLNAGRSLWLCKSGEGEVVEEGKPVGAYRRMAHGHIDGLASI